MLFGLVSSLASFYLCENGYHYVTMSKRDAKEPPANRKEDEKEQFATSS